MAFAGAAALVLIYALRGGSYDIVVFQEQGLVICWVLALGLALGLLPRSRPSRLVVMLLGALGVYAAWTALSLIWTASPALTTEELARSLDYLALVALVALSVDSTTWRAAAAGLGFSALLVCVFAVGSRLAPSVFGRDHLDVALHINRMSVPFGYWNAVAAWGAMCTAVGLAWSAHDPARLRRAAALGLVPVAGLTTYLTYSRTGAIGTAAAVLTVLAVSRHRFTVMIHTAVAAAGTALAVLAVRHAPQIADGTGSHGSSTVLAALLLAVALCAVTAVSTHAGRTDRWRLPRSKLRPLAALSAAVIVVAGAVFGPGLANHAWHSFTGSSTALTSTDPAARLTTLSGIRYPVWRSALKGFAAHPVGGTGAGTFEFWWNQHGTNGEFVRDAHSLWLENMQELGLPGLLLILAVAVSALMAGFAVLREARRRQSAGIAAAFLASFIVYLLHASVDWMWESTAVTVLALAGIAVIAGRFGERPWRLRWPGRTVLALAALLAAAVQLPGLLSTEAVRRSQTAERSGQANLALSWARGAVDAEPWSASAYEQRGLLFESVGDLRSAARDLRRAISYEPTNYVHWLALARIDTELGYLDAAAHSYDRARRLRPEASVFALTPR